MNFDEIFDHIGDIGLYQILLFFVVGTCSFINGLQNLLIVFVGADQDHWCRVPRLQDFPHDLQKYVAVPFTDESPTGYDSCSYYDLDYESLTDDDIWNWNRTGVNVSTIECTDGWVYDQSEFTSTINSKYDLVCGRSWMSQFVSTAYMFGIMVGSILSGIISDKFGRYKPLLLGCLGHFAFGLAQAFSPNYPVFVVMRSLTSMSNFTAYLCSFIIMAEFVGSRYRTILGVIYQMFFSFGIMLTSGVAYAVRDSQKVLLVAAGMVCSTVPFIWIVPESPRWLISKERYGEAAKILRKVAAVNGRTFPDKIDWTKSKEDTPQTDQDDEVTFSQVCQSRILCGELALMFLNWFTTSLVYYGLGLNAGAFGGLHLNNFLNGVIEVPALVLCAVLMDRASNRISNAGCLLVAGLFCIACVPVIELTEGLDQLLTAFSTIGKGAITFSYACIYLISAEMFPTSVRTKAVGSSSVFARLGSMAAPFIGAPMEEIWKPLPSTIFGSLAIFTGCLVFLLPETRGHKLPDTIEEAERIGRFRKQQKSARRAKEEAMSGAFHNEGFKNDKLDDAEIQDHCRLQTQEDVVSSRL